MRMIPTLYSKLFLRGTFVVDTPVHTGCCQESVARELTLYRRGDGRWFVSGADLARHLRRWFQFAVIGSATRWGRERGTLPSDQPLANSLEVEDLFIENQGDLLWDDAASDYNLERGDGDAGPNRGILPRGTKMAFCLIVGTPDVQQRDSAVESLSWLKDALEKGLIRLGALTYPHLGRVHLENGRLYEQRFASRSGILATLRNRRGHPVRLKQPSALTNSRIRVAREARLTFAIDWQPLGPLAVQGVSRHPAENNCPVCSGSASQVVFVLSGGTIRQALRRRAVQILRTMVSRNSSRLQRPTAARKPSVRGAIWDGIDALFGPANQPAHTQVSAEPTKRTARRAGSQAHQTASLPGQGAALEVLDCHALANHAGPQWIWHLSDAQTLTAIVDTRESKAPQSDRTDPAGRQCMASALASGTDSLNCRVWHTFLGSDEVRWQPLRWQLNLPALATWKMVLPATALVLLLIEELRQGRIRLGLATRQGMGAVRIHSVGICGEYLPQPLQPLADVMLPDGSLDRLPSPIRHQLTAAWLAWLYDAENGRS